MHVVLQQDEAAKVAYLGPAGSFLQSALQLLLGHRTQEIPKSSIDEVFAAVENGEAAWAVVPIENSNEGAVNRSLDLLRTQNVVVYAEIALPIEHCLLSRKQERTEIDTEIRTIFAHPQAAAQCHSWLLKNFPTVSVEAALSNSEAALRATTTEKSAAIAGAHAASLYGLQILSKNIQDDIHNRTRFFLLGVDSTQRGHEIKVGTAVQHYYTSLILAVKNEAGAVYRLLAPLAENGVSMIRFESRPARGASWEYFFYIDIEGRADSPHIAKALGSLQKMAAFYKSLGSYPFFAQSSKNL